MFTAVLLRRVDRFEIGAQGISHVTTEMDHTEVTGDLGEGGSVAAGGEKPDWRVFNQNVIVGGKGDPSSTF